MALKDDKSTFCIDCLYVFDKRKKYHAQDRCNGCYQKLYVRNQIVKIYGVSARPKNKETKCSCCGFEYEKLNDKGKVVKQGPKKMCKRCYTQNNRPVKVCKKCGNEMIKGSSTGLCAVCKLDKPTVRKRKEPQLPLVEKEQFELIRRLLVRYKVGHNNMADAFRVADIYMEVNNNPILLDTLSESAQIVEMLRNLKDIFYYNLENKPKSKKKYKTKNITNDMKAYRRTWYMNNKERIKIRKLLNGKSKEEKIPV
jgi:hypothetical protein